MPKDAPQKENRSVCDDTTCRPKWQRQANTILTMSSKTGNKRSSLSCCVSCCPLYGSLCLVKHSLQGASCCCVVPARTNIPTSVICVTRRQCDYCFRSDCKQAQGIVFMPSSGKRKQQSFNSLAASYFGSLRLVQFVAWRLRCGAADRPTGTAALASLASLAKEPFHCRGPTGLQEQSS